MFIIDLVKKLFFFIQGLFLYSLLALPAFADAAPAPASAQTSIDPCSAEAQKTGGIATMLCKLGGDNIGNTIRNVIVFFVIIGVIFALVFLLLGGIKWITSKGEKTEVEAARNQIVAALVGLLFIILAVFLLSIVLSAFGINWADLVIPNIGSTTPQQ